MRVLSKAFGKLKLMLPWVPPDTKLSKLDTLRLATSYISHLQRVLDDNGDEYSSINETKFQTRSLVSISFPFLQGCNRPWKCYQNLSGMDQINWLSKLLNQFLQLIQLLSKLYKRLLNKPYVNGVTLTGHNLSFKCCQSLEHKVAHPAKIDLNKK